MFYFATLLIISAYAATFAFLSAIPRDEDDAALVVLNDNDV